MNPANKYMNISKEGLLALKILENCRLKPYDDKTGKIITKWCKGATIGIGHLIPFFSWRKFKNGIDEEGAYNLLKKDIARFEKATRRMVRVNLNQNQFDALCIFSFNIGVGGFKSSSLLMWINNEGDKTIYKDTESAWKAWVKSDGVVVPGLINRRNEEWKIYTNNSFLGGYKSKEV